MTKEKVDKPTNLLGKIHKLQEIMASYKWEKDGRNMHQKYKYITEAQYKNNFKKALQEVGLVWKMEEVDREFLGQISQSMHLVMVKFKGELIDPETGEREVYIFGGSGADGGDKALYKAYTGGLKYFLASNFLVAEEDDPEGDEKVDIATYVSPQEKEEIKNNLTSGQANKMQIDALKKQLVTLVSKDEKYKEYVKRIQSETNDLQNITKTQCENYIIEIGKILKGGK